MGLSYLHDGESKGAVDCSESQKQGICRSSILFEVFF